MSIKIGDKFKEFLYSDKRESSSFDIKIGEVKSLITRNGNDYVLISFDKKGQLKVRTEIEVSMLEKLGDFWVRRFYNTNQS